MAKYNNNNIRDGPNPEEKDSNPNPNYFSLLESESESTQVCNGFESILIMRVYEHALKAQYRVHLYVLHIQTLIYLNVSDLLILYYD